MPLNLDVATKPKYRLDFGETVSEERTIIDILTNATRETEGLMSGQTPLRIQWNEEGESPYKDTIQGIPIDWEAHKNAPTERQNFYFVPKGQEDTVINKQWMRYFTNPENFGLTEDSTLKEAIEKFDQEHPENKLHLLEQENIPNLSIY